MRKFVTSRRHIWALFIAMLVMAAGSLGVSSAAFAFPESAHPYTNSFDDTWTYTVAGSPSSIEVTFSTDTETESGFDYIHIMDGSGVSIDGSPFDGRELAGVTVTVPGDTVQIRLTTDGSVTRYGFRVTDIVGTGAGFEFPESPHPYANGYDNTWTYTVAGSPSAIDVTFSSKTRTETCCDRIYIMDGDGFDIEGSPFAGDSLAGRTITVPGDTVQIRLTTDYSVTYYGFRVTSIEASDGTSGIDPDDPCSTTVAAPADVIFLFDTTGSMGGEISDAKANAISFANDLETNGVDYRLGLIEFRDIAVDGTMGLVNHGMTDTADGFRELVDPLSASGGGDYPESSIDAIKEAAVNLGLREDAAKIFILITDATPLLPPASGTRTSPEEALDLMNRHNITFFSVSPSDTTYDDMVAETGGQWWNISTGGDFTVILDSINDEIVLEARKPLASAGVDQSAGAGALVTLDGSDSSTVDSLISIESYLWEQLDGPTTVTLTDPASSRATFTMPADAAEGDVYTFQLTVSDSCGRSGTDTVAITVGSIAEGCVINLISPLDSDVLSHDGAGGQVNFIFTTCPTAASYMLNVNLSDMLTGAEIPLSIPLVPATSSGPFGGGTEGTPGFTTGFGMATFTVPFDLETWSGLAVYDWSWNVVPMSEDGTPIGSSNELGLKLQPIGSVSLTAPIDNANLSKDSSSVPRFSWELYSGADTYAMVLAHVSGLSFDWVGVYEDLILNAFPMDAATWASMPTGEWLWTVMGFDDKGAVVTPNFILYDFTVE